MQYLSCAPSFLYPEGPYGEASVQDSLLRTGLSRAGQSTPLFWIYEPETIQRAATIDFITGNADWRQGLTDAHARATTIGTGSMLCHLRDVYVNNNAVYFGGSPETTMLYEMHRPTDRAMTAVNHNIGIRPATEFRHGVDGRSYLYITGAGVENYGHWLVDDLPRLKAAEMMIEMAPHLRPTILLTSHSPIMDEVRVASIAAHAKLSNVDVLFLDKATNYHFDSLFYASPVSYHPVMKLRSALRYVRQSFHLDQVGSARPRRLFVTRATTSGRRIANLEEVEEHLRAQGFDFIDCGSLPFREQAARFAAADVIVGVMGAAMTNTIFAPEGAAVVPLACEGWPEPFYQDLADGCGHRSISVYGPPTEAGAVYSVPFHIAPQQIDEALALVGAL